ncbi:MAG: hypothetical protein J6K42_00105 [Clostridia bacterium]|nr:hypothetical protein [Clostridia bacterium]
MKRLLKNIGKSVVFTSFIVIIFVLIYQVVLIYANDYFIESDEYMKDTYINFSKNFEDELDNEGLQGDERLLREGKIMYSILLEGQKSTIKTMAYALVISVFIGIGIGYSKTVVDSIPSKFNAMKKIMVVYGIGVVAILGIAMLVDNSRNTSEGDELLGIITFTVFTAWTIIYLLILKSKISSNKKQANNLKKAFENMKEKEL